MRTFELDRAVARATGESLATIRSQGFSLLEESLEPFDPEPDLRPAQIVDWDEIDRQRRRAAA